ncbi:hypothetical protein Hanom_Chr08g00719071 [Helianthus anomalus]
MSPAAEVIVVDGGVRAQTTGSTKPVLVRVKRSDYELVLVNSSQLISDSFSGQQSNRVNGSGQIWSIVVRAFQFSWI